MFVTGSPVDMDDDISAQGLTQVMTSQWLSLSTLVFNVETYMAYLSCSVCGKLCKKGYCSASRDI